MKKFAPEQEQRTWWKEAVVYQIYPRSFQDSDGDGIGDLPGIISRLDHLKELGVDVIWLSPIYKSPNDDNGYDIADYYEIMAEFGTMENFEELLEGVHQRGMKLIMDLVVNHTSDEHAWFEESRKSKDNPKRDYYIWRKGKNGGPPNNWPSFFGGSAWQHDPTTDEYFLHLFTKKQPDLNWENEEVRQEVYQMMRYWLDKGVDGFRMDVIPLISKRLEFADTDIDDFGQIIAQVYSNGPRVHEFINEMYRESLADYDVMTVGEAVGIDQEQAKLYVGYERNELNMIFQFGHMFIDHGKRSKFEPGSYTLQQFKKVFVEWDEALEGIGWNAIFLDNHDFPRMVSRFGNDKEYWAESAKLLVTLLTTLRGTTYLYQGSEIGMTNVAFDSIDDYRDVETLNYYKEAQERGENMDDFLKMVHKQGRDNVRTPIQWSAEAQGGFTTGTPWLKVNPNYKSINVAAQKDDPSSVLSFYKKAIQLRKQHPLLVYGSFEQLDNGHEQLFTYERALDGKKLWVALNFSDRPATAHLPAEAAAAKVLQHNYSDEPTVSKKLELRPWEAVVLG